VCGHGSLVLNIVRNELINEYICTSISIDLVLSSILIKDDCNNGKEPELYNCSSPLESW
jgi:hypothetical protein